MNILVAGDVVSSPGRSAFATVTRTMRQENTLDVAVANAENAAGGNGITPRLAQELFRAGADALTLGDHAWDKKESYSFIEEEHRLIRPANFSSMCPGRGWTVIEKNDIRLCLISLVGRVFMPPVDCPFKAIDELLNLPHIRDIPIKIVDFHAEATSEKICMGYYLDGRVSALLGSHTHVQTSDERILDKGTGYITDLGMTGPLQSVLGREFAPVLNRFLTGMPAKFDVMKTGPRVFEGALLNVDEHSGTCRSIQRIRRIMHNTGVTVSHDD